MKWTGINFQIKKKWNWDKKFIENKKQLNMLMKMLSKEKDDRYNRVADIITDLEKKESPVSV